MRTIDFDTLNLHWLQPSRIHNKALQLTIFPLRNGKTAAELCVNRVIELNSPSFQSYAG
jgi:hypothetical protein